MLAHVRSQMNPRMCAKFGANWSSRLVGFPDFLIFDPVNPPPHVPPRSHGAHFYFAHYLFYVNLHMCAKFGSDRTTDGDVYMLGRIHTQTHTLLYRY